METAISTIDFRTRDSLRFRAKVAVHIILERAGEVLLLRRFNTGVEDGMYVLPMGGLEENEVPTAAALREAFEEVNAIIDPRDITFAHAMYRKHTQPDGYIYYQQDLIFHSTTFTGDIRNMEPHKADHVAFFPLESLPSPMAPMADALLKAYLAGVPYSEFGFE